jgi:hypothetical protein
MRPIVYGVLLVMIHRYPVDREHTPLLGDTLDQCDCFRGGRTHGYWRLA